MPTLSVRALELPARWNAADEALADVDTLLSRAPADLVVLPEASLTGYLSPRGDTDLRPFAERVGGRTTEALAGLARKHRVHLAGPLVEKDGGAFYNTTVVVTPTGEVLARYRKRHPWIVETWATAGREPTPLFEVCGVRVTIAVCYDLHFLPSESSDALRAADVLLFPSAWVEDPDLRETRFTALAKRFGVAIVNANWGVGAPRVEGQGQSMVVSARGERLAMAAEGQGAQSVEAEIDSGRTAQAR